VQAVEFTWIGHSCYLLTTQNGIRILIDPYDESIGYPKHDLQADIVCTSHDHFDHNHLNMVQGEYILIKEAGITSHDGIRIQAILTNHDDCGGAKRGKNLVFLIEADGIRVAHLGDLGEVPEEPVREALTPLNVLLAPVGGTYTIGPKEARQIANAIKTRVLVPMHYQTPVLRLNKELLPVESLISEARDCGIHKLNQPHFVITPDYTGEDRILVPDYLRANA
jgi:L-ascorbate metabolism protein UlaG (beta-lactamase superfamily)